MSGQCPQQRSAASALTAVDVVVATLMPGCVVSAYAAGDNVSIERVEQRDGEPLWAVRNVGQVLNRDMDWEWKPSPSSRDDAFYARARFETPQEALRVLTAARQRDVDTGASSAT